MKTVKNTTYDDILNEIDTELNKGEIKKALDLIEEELRMPYIPPFVSAKLHQFKEIAMTAQKMNNEIHLDMSEEGILKYLHQDELHQLRALEAFSVMNMRTILPLVQEAFNCIDGRLLKCLLTKLTIEQALTESFTFSDEGVTYEFIPASLTLPEDSEGYQEGRAYLKRWLEDDDPSMLKLCLDQIELECLMKLPQSIDEDEAFDLAFEILKTIFLMISTPEHFEKFCEDKGIQKNGHLALFN
jgi:hypothetical protein